MKPSARTLAIIFIAAPLIVAAFAAHAQAPSTPKLAEAEFLNIKILKGIPADQIGPAMQFITAALGVECEYCHVRGERGLIFEKDDKKTKLAARKMIEMMNAINKDNFDGKREVTCYSCHHGAPDPVGTPIITDQGPKIGPTGGQKPGDAQAGLPPADQFFDKYLAAVGGADAVQKITSRVGKGTLTGFGGQHFPVDIYDKAPGKSSFFMHLPGGDSTISFDGHTGWLGTPGRAPHIMIPDEIEAARMDGDLSLPVHLKTLRQKFVTEPSEKIDGHDTVQVTGRSEGQPPLHFYFDSQSGLLLRLVRYNETPLGRLPTQIDYSDYRDTDGVKIPFHWTLARPGNRFSIQVDEVHQNVPVDDAKFPPPPPPPPPQKH
jgi:photosynthetic reaction center cytochrome c subunit